MFKRFITWLVIRFLKSDDLLKIVSDRLMHRGQDRFIMQRLYQVHEKNRDGDIDYVSFNTLCLETLLLQFTPRELSGLHLLAFMRNNRSQSDDGRKLAEAITEAVAIPNKLKRTVEVKAVLADAFPILDAYDISVLAATAIESNYTVDVYVAFLNSSKGARHDQ